MISRLVTFTVTEKPRAQQEWFTMDLSAKCGSVLIADCHPGMLGAVRSLLAEMFEMVVMVSDEASLIVAIQRLQPSLVVVDLSLPVAGHRHIVQRLGEQFPALKMIVLSVHSEAEAAQSALRAGAAGYVLKGAAVTDLAEAVRAVRGGKTYVSSTVVP